MDLMSLTLTLFLLMDFCSTGTAVVYERPFNWCLVRCMGQKVFPAADSVLYLCPHPTDEDKPMVGVAGSGHTVLFVCSHMAVM